MGMFCSFTARQIKIFITISTINTCNAFCFALQAPFYPEVAEKKGLHGSEIGIIFGIFQLAIFLISPFFGRYITKVGSKRMLVTGIAITGCSCICFGSLVYINNPIFFFSASFILRIIEAIGCAMCNTASFSIVAQEFPDTVGSAMASLETCFGLGLIIGPAVGGGFYQLWGYFSPFAILGTCLVLCACFAGYNLPKTDLKENNENSIKLQNLMKIPEIALSMLGTFSASTNIGYFQAILEPHIRFLNLSQVTLGLVFTVSGLVYALIAPIWGKLCDYGISTLFLPIMGGFFIVDAFHLFGPPPYIPVDPSFRLVIIALVLNGIGIGGELIPSFTGAQKFAVEAGYPQNMKTLGTVSGLWTAFFALGAFVGPTLGGILKDHFGVRYSTLYIICLHTFLMISHAVFLLYKHICAPCRGNKGTWETTKLLTDADFDDSSTPSSESRSRVNDSGSNDSPPYVIHILDENFKKIGLEIKKNSDSENSEISENDDSDLAQSFILDKTCDSSNSTIDKNDPIDKHADS